MAITKITIPLDAEAAEIYAQYPSEVQKKVRLLVSLWLRDFVFSERPLQAVMDEISKNAQSRGLTPEILESLLHAD
jgi:hypothetical protein